MIVFDI